MKLLPLLALGLALVAASSSGAAGGTSLVTADPSWSPDGTRIAFDARAGDGPADVYTVSVDGSGLRDLTPGGREWNTLPSWSRRGSLIAYETDTSNAQVVSVLCSVVAPDGTSQRDLVLGTAVGPIYWSPGDRYIAFDGRFDADVVPLGATCCDAARQIAPASSGPWAPREMRLVVGMESGHLVTTNPVGTQRRRLTHGKEELRPLAWSRSGRWILFEGARGESTRFDLYVVRVTTGLVRRLAPGARLGSFSPDAKQVAYSTGRGGISIVSIDGRSRRRLTADGSGPLWSPDGHWIALESSRGIELIRPDGTGRHPLLAP